MTTRSGIAAAAIVPDPNGAAGQHRPHPLGGLPRAARPGQAAPTVLRSPGRERGVVRAIPVGALIGALTGVMLAAGVLAGAVGRPVIAAAAALLPAALAAAVDARLGRLPDVLVALVAAPVATAVTARVVLGEPAALAGPVAGALVIATPLFVLHLLSAAAMGFGDVKLGAALGAVLGLGAPLAGLVALCVGSGATGLVALPTRRTTVAFGPGLVAGAAALVAWPPLADLVEVTTWR